MSDDFGEAVREAREKKGWSQEFLAARVGATQSTIDRIESGATRRSRVLPDIAAALDLELPGVSKPTAAPQTVSSLSRVTYVLPNELLERVAEYKNAVGIPSDDEAIRRLIDDALKHRDDYFTIIERLMNKFYVLKSLREAAGYVLANHPLVKNIVFEGNDLKFILNNDYTVNVNSRGSAVITDDYNQYIKIRSSKTPNWGTHLNFANMYDLDDDIPE
ncbi:helix-turn-helix domain-containing protein [Methylobacterium brachiatum]|uniref:helix-turn-helix domain-containing protein n=1 Tax=Methylobacterium brachiatum TaxID=269660 RepID=UPI000EFD8FFD|nr:helix-turn-helix domain-containing protein [Methylobacterium brachiatum]AYO83682.1 helix-turn-helix domain-containing protein [Methylobacterium brachiatum]